jgi:hypothetical protein
MIQYPISKQQLEVLLEQEKPGWLARAEGRTQNFAHLGYSAEDSSTWSEVKIVFMHLQHNKCAYCERKLESEEFGSIEHDLEHFRPKKKAKPWKLTNALKQAGVVLTSPVEGNADPGYHLLAYHPLNYCTSCKTCNSSLKNDNFPIEGIRSSGGADPVQLRSEKPLLVNPVGNFDDDPASLISFHGLSPMARGNSDYQKHRGLVTIAFFHLDDHRRKNLFRERANIIVSLHSFLKLADQADNPVDKAVYKSLVDVFTRPSSSHTNCALSFLSLYQNNQDEANELFHSTAEYLNSISD